MSENNSKPPTEDEIAFRKMFSLFAGFAPSMVAIACFHLKNPGQSLLPLLIILNLICSIVASIGLLRGMKNEGLQILFSFLLIPFFFVLNVLIAIFVGCSGMGGRIAP